MGLLSSVGPDDEVPRSLARDQHNKNQPYLRHKNVKKTEYMGGETMGFRVYASALRICSPPIELDRGPINVFYYPVMLNARIN